ncbi:MAG: hypothetical protein HY847_08470 [Betaproteobacteria bacterium]|nr:hypothetical protein [Betaproteobacteria bacterium]
MSTDTNTRRDFAGRGLIINLLRAVHLVGVVGLGAAVLGAVTSPATAWYAALLVASGIGIAALDRWAEPAYFRQFNGQLVFLKLVLLILVGWWTGVDATLFWVLLVASALMTHAPGRVRHRQLF